MKLDGECSTERLPNGDDQNDPNVMLLEPYRKGSAFKVTIAPAQPKTLTHLPKRPPVDLAFSELTYKVTEGKKNSKFIFIF